MHVVRNSSMYDDMKERCNSATLVLSKPKDPDGCEAKAKTHQDVFTSVDYKHKHKNADHLFMYTPIHSLVS